MIRVKQLYEKNGDEFVEFNPQIDLNSILESVTERSIAYIFHHYNHFNADWTNTQELTRAQVPPQIRRSNLWLSYTNNTNTKITERFIGTNLDASVYERWIDSQYWEKIDFDFLESGVKEAVEYIFLNIDKYPALKAVIKNIVKEIYDEVAGYITQVLGSSTTLAISQKTLTDTINKIWDKLESITGDVTRNINMTVTPLYFTSDEGCNVHITANIANVAGIFESVAFYLDGTLLAKAENTDSFEYDTVVSRTTVVQCVAKILGVEYRAEKTITRLND